MNGRYTQNKWEEFLVDTRKKIKYNSKKYNKKPCLKIVKKNYRYV